VHESCGREEDKTPQLGKRVRRFKLKCAMRELGSSKDGLRGGSPAKGTNDILHQKGGRLGIRAHNWEGCGQVKKKTQKQLERQR